ncbi:hypothetical protein HMPREF9445_00762 [Bacteroides clarus YIT 12056]|uniref:Uncharacterized protein n=1 Tax=Bacteroides clarus YIT 12056 TaxID=762984 RepID=A0ABP2KUZ7_9BACE|nr:hypothetical protein HMPREF9445_00762 [Bacteroides clarus YIT 12056]
MFLQVKFLLLCSITVNKSKKPYQAYQLYNQYYIGVITRK